MSYGSFGILNISCIEWNVVLKPIPLLNPLTGHAKVYHIRTDKLIFLALGQVQTLPHTKLVSFLQFVFIFNHMIYLKLFWRINF